MGAKSAIVADNLIADIHREKLLIWKNVIVVSLGFLLQFTAFLSISALQSSINSDSGLGTYSLTTIYVALIFSSLFLVTWTMDVLTPKWTMVFCNLCYLGYTCAQYKPTFFTMIPAAVVIGLAAAPLWAAKCTYISVVGRRYSVLSSMERKLANSEKPSVLPTSETGCEDASKKIAANVLDGDKPTVVVFFGLFFAFFHSSGIWGNLITSTVLSVGENTASPKDDSQVALCGRNFCDEITDEVENLRRPDEWKIRLISGIFIGVALCSALLMGLFLDPLSRFDADYERRKGCDRGTSEVSALVTSALKQMKDSRQALLTVLVFYNGLERGFFDADFNKAFVGCAWGIQNIGYVLMVGRAVNSISSVMCGKLFEFTGRIPLLAFAFLINVSGLLYLLYWEPRTGQVSALFVMAAILMLSDALWGTQINGLHGVIFHDNVEAAFSVYKVWESFGFIVAYFVNPLLCVRVKLYGMISVLTVGIMGYALMEVIEARRKQKA